MGSFRARATPALLAEGPPFGDALSSNLTPRGISQFTLADDWVLSPHLVNHFAASEVGFHITQNSQPLNPADWPAIAGATRRPSPASVSPLTAMRLWAWVWGIAV